MALALRRRTELVLAIGAGLLAACSPPPELRPRLGERQEWVHEGAPHAAHVSASALALASDGTPHLAWISSDASGRGVWLAQLAAGGFEVLRVDPPGQAPSGGHQAPGLAIGPDDRVHVSWSTPRSDAGGSAFASDLVVASRASGAAGFDPPRRVHEDVPGSRGFEGLAVDTTGALVVAWLEAGATARTRVARLAATGASVATLDTRSCPCCRVAVAADARGRVALSWRDETPEGVRDLLFALAPGAEAAPPPRRVHRDGWALAACPHRGAALAFAPDGRSVVAWYTEGRTGEPALQLAVGDASGFGAPISVHDDPASLPDRVALAVDRAGEGLVLWEQRTPARSAIAARSLRVADGRLGPVQVISRGIQAAHPAVVAAPDAGFVAAWQEEAFPTLRTVVAPIRLATPSAE